MKNQSRKLSFLKDLLKQGKQSLQCMEEVVHVQFFKKNFTIKLNSSTPQLILMNKGSINELLAL